MLGPPARLLQAHGRGPLGERRAQRLCAEHVHQLILQCHARPGHWPVAESPVRRLKVLAWLARRTSLMAPHAVRKECQGERANASKLA